MCDKVDEKNCQFRRIEIYYVPIISLYPYIPIYISLYCIPKKFKENTEYEISVNFITKLNNALYLQSIH